MSIEQNKATVRRFTEGVWIGRQYDVIDECFAEDYQDPEIVHIPALLGGPEGLTPREGLKFFFRKYFERRPTFEVLSEQLTAEDDRVVQYIRGRFVNEEEKHGEVGAEFRMHEINIFTLRDGRIVGRMGIGTSRTRAREIEFGLD